MTVKTQCTSKRAEKGRALFYSRDSGGRHEQTPAQYVEWAQRKTSELGVRFTGTGEAINEMIRCGAPVSGDIYFDCDVQGNQWSRPALDALRERLVRDQNVSHLLIPRRDRLARPDNATDGVALELELRLSGVTLVFMDKILGPLSKGRRQDFAEALTAMIEYQQNGDFRRVLAEKMIFAQIQLARQGFSTGGRAPFGFRRVLASLEGKIIRPLEDGEKVRIAGHHVVWTPGDPDELELIRRILEMLEVMPATQVARQLNKEGIASPDAGRIRKDNGIKHAVSGLWHQTTIVNIARNPLLRAIVTYGRRSMGDQRRATAEGPRELVDGDYFDGKPKVTRNSDAAITTAAARFEPVIPNERFDRLLTTLNERGGTQRGKPRSRKPDENPLGTRVFDLACSWPMYRQPYNGSFRYTCGLYQQSHAAKCSHNHVDGQLASRFVLAAIRQRLLSPEMLKRLEQKLRARAAASNDNNQTRAMTNLEAALTQVRSEREIAKRNLARAKNDEQYEAISEEFETLLVREKHLLEEIAGLQSTSSQSVRQRTVESALGVLNRLTGLADDPQNLRSVGRLFALLNVQLFLRFRPVQKRRRREQKLSGGLLTFGEVAPPITKYGGPTSRRALMFDGQDVQAPTSSRMGANGVFSTDEEESLGNVSRGDRI